MVLIPRHLLLRARQCTTEASVSFSASPSLLLASRRTGRGVASEFQCRDTGRLRDSEKKTFTREWGKRYGFSSGLDDLMVVLSVGGSGKQRHLDAKKRLQLSVVFQHALIEVIEADEQLVTLSLSMSKVDVSPAFTEIRVSWLAKGDDSDRATSETLAAAESSLRWKLAEKFANTRIPALKFEIDEQHLLKMKMDKLFEEADYGMQYRALSHTGAVLGSLSDSGISPSDQQKKEREAANPRQLRGLEERKAAATKLDSITTDAS